ncbi:hypothetical protein K435DRAFT_878812 [Dendrothele bispora CBS 962.96]|uniref:Uncharacterized protein n=1 Tax=Dendrothele bispora (strain CBS 962.96) TaxID=1314807 RepID=A0A4S8KM64_DENBC|nr:hypothetical protein K435DRAFT_878812 [Dendrothele bispora CBS 962.96]
MPAPSEIPTFSPIGQSHKSFQTVAERCGPRSSMAYIFDYYLATRKAPIPERLLRFLCFRYNCEVRKGIARDDLPPGSTAIVLLYNHLDADPKIWLTALTVNFVLPPFYWQKFLSDLWLAYSICESRGELSREITSCSPLWLACPFPSPGYRHSRTGIWTRTLTKIIHIRNALLFQIYHELCTQGFGKSNFVRNYLENYRARRTWVRKHSPTDYLRAHYPGDDTPSVTGNPFFEQWELDFFGQVADIFDWLDATEGTGYSGITAMLRKILEMRLTPFHLDIRKSMRSFCPILTYDDSSLDYRVD